MRSRGSERAECRDCRGGNCRAERKTNAPIRHRDGLGERGKFRTNYVISRELVGGLVGSNKTQTLLVGSTRVGHSGEPEPPKARTTESQNHRNQNDNSLDADATDDADRSNAAQHGEPQRARVEMNTLGRPLPQHPERFITTSVVAPSPDGYPHSEQSASSGHPR